MNRGEKRKKRVKAAEAVRTYRKDLSLVARQVVGLKLTKRQRQILRIMSSPGTRLAVASGHGPGKTYAAAALVLAFTSCYPGCRVLTTAPTFTQVRDLLWSEVRKLHRRSVMPLGGKVDLVRWTLDDDWFAVGISTKEPERFQGRHAKHVLVVFDEAPGVPEPIWMGAEALMTGEDCRWLAIGNPVSPGDKFAECWKDAAWRTLTVSSYEAPNVTGEMHVPGGVTAQWIERMEQKFSKDSPVFKCRVLGEFPDGDSEQIIAPLSWVEKSRRIERDRPDSNEYPKLGVDVARFGKDETVFCIRQGGDIWLYKTLAVSSVTEVIGHTIKLCREWKIRGSEVYVDDTGVGGGVVDGLHEAYSPTVNAVNFGSAPTDSEHFANKKAEMYWSIRKALDPESPMGYDGPRLKIPEGEDLLAEDLSQRYTLNSKGRIIMEPKEEFTKRVGRSPDRGDALALTFAGVIRHKHKPEVYIL